MKREKWESRESIVQQQQQQVLCSWLLLAKRQLAARLP